MKVYRAYSVCLLSCNNRKTGMMMTKTSTMKMMIMHIFLTDISALNGLVLFRLTQSAPLINYWSVNDIIK